MLESPRHRSVAGHGVAEHVEQRPEYLVIGGIVLGRQHGAARGRERMSILRHTVAGARPGAGHAPEQGAERAKQDLLADGLSHEIGPGLAPFHELDRPAQEEHAERWPALEQRVRERLVRTLDAGIEHHHVDARLRFERRNDLGARRKVAGLEPEALREQAKLAALRVRRHDEQGGAREY
jgi:hypothetical protein